MEPVCTIDKQNIIAWDFLYSQTRQLVWGVKEASFIGYGLEFLASRAPKFKEPLRVMDAGCGEGRNVPALLASGARVYCCDASLSGLKKIPKEVSAQAACLCVLDLGELPWKDCLFHGIFMVDVLETLPNPHKVLKELNRVLDPYGILVCNIPDEQDSIYGIEMQKREDGGFLYRNCYYFRFYSRHEAICLLEGCGFEIVGERVFSWVEPPHPNFRDKAHIHTSRVFVAGKRG